MSRAASASAGRTTPTSMFGSVGSGSLKGISRSFVARVQVVQAVQLLRSVQTVSEVSVVRTSDSFPPLRRGCVAIPNLEQRWETDSMFSSKSKVESQIPLQVAFKVGQHQSNFDSVLNCDKVSSRGRTKEGVEPLERFEPLERVHLTPSPSSNLPPDNASSSRSRCPASSRSSPVSKCPCHPCRRLPPW